MPTIKQLPAATAVTAGDLLPVSQGGLTRSVTVTTLLSSAQPTIALTQDTLLGRVSPGVGGPEAVGVGTGLLVQAGSISASGADHLSFPLSASLLMDDEIILNSNMAPKRITATKLRGLFSAGAGVSIDDSGVISSTGGGASGTAVQGPKGDTGAQGAPGQGFNFRGTWQANTAYAAYDIVTYGGQTYVAISSLVSGSTFTSTAWALLAAQGTPGVTGPAGQPGPTVAATSTSIGAVKAGSGLSVSVDGSLSIASVSLSTVAQGGAAIGQVLGWTGTSWGPTTLTTPIYSGTSPVGVSNGVISLLQAGATAGQVLAWSGTGWSPQTLPSGVLGSIVPLVDGVGSQGTSNNAAREDHRHPTDLSRAPLANAVFVGSITLPSWTSSARPGSPVVGMEGYATDLGRRETYTPAGWTQYVRVSDIPTANGQLLGGSAVPGVTSAITLGAGLSLSGGTLSVTSNYVLPAASVSALGGVKQGSGVTIAADGTISATGTSGVTSFNARSGSVTLALSDVSAVLGSGSAARANLGLAAVAASGSFADLSGAPSIPVAGVILPSMNGTAATGSAAAYARADHAHPTDTSRLAVSSNLSDLASPVTARSNLGLGASAILGIGTVAGTVAAGNDSRITGALQAASIPPAAAQLLGGSGTAGAASAVSVGTGLVLSGGTLSATSSGSSPIPVASTTTLGGIKSDGATVQIATDGTLTVSGVSIAALTDISSGSLGGPALSDIDTLNRGGTDYKVTLSARSTLFRKTPTSSRTISLSSGSMAATLTATDNDKTVVVTGTVAGSLAVDGTITDGFRCQVINHSGFPLTLSGITGLGATNVANAASCWITLANSSVEASLIGTSNSTTSYALQPASPSQLGGIKPDGTSVTTTSDGTLSVLTISTHALPASAGPTAADEIAAYAITNSSDVKYTMAQLSSFGQSNLQSWTTSARPIYGATQFGFGFNSTLGRFEFWNGTAWNQHCRLSDFAASSTQLYAGSSSNGVATPINIGAGLSLSGSTLSASAVSTSSTVPVTTIIVSGSTQTLSFPTSGSRAYDITLAANCNLSLSGGTNGELQTITLVIRGGAGGFTVSLPSSIKWPGGVAPAVDTSSGSYNEFYIRTIDGGATYSGNY